MQKLAKGSFEVSLKPLASDEKPNESALGRMSLDKQFVGDLVAVGKGEMLTAVTQTKGSAGYVAIERVTGTLHGREGSFVFQHSGTVDKGAQSLVISVVPDSGTDQLAGLSGHFTLKIEAGKHFYEFEYSLPTDSE